MKDTSTKFLDDNGHCGFMRFFRLDDADSFHCSVFIYNDNNERQC